MKDQTFNSPDELLRSLRFCVLDLETTGGNVETEKIIEVGMVRVENRTITEERNFLINPDKEIPEFVQKLTGIKKADVSHAPKIEEVIDEISQFIGDSIVVAHNTSFDVPFINGVLKQLGRPTLDNKVICTNIMTKYMIPDIMSSNLGYMSTIFGIPHSHAHRAVEDARATANLLLKYLEIFDNKNIRKVNQLYYPRNKFELDRSIFEPADGLEKVYQSLETLTRPTILTVKGDNGVILSILPIKNPKLELNELKTYLEDFRWNQINIRLCGPFVEGLFFLNNNFLKIPEVYRKKTLDYLHAHHQVSLAELNEDFDFIITPHLISGQFIVWSFLNFNSYSQLVFKYPSHKKKLHQFLLGQIGRFETQQKGKRKAFVQNDLRDVFLSIFRKELEASKGLYLKVKIDEIKHDKKPYQERLEKLASTFPDPYSFPSTYL